MSAVLLDENRNVTGRKELDTGTARSNQNETRRVSLNKLSSYDHYYLELEVYFKEYAIETNDAKITDRNFGYINDRQPESIAGVHVSIDPASLIFTMDWSDFKVSCDQYVAAYYTDVSPDAPVDYQSLESGYTSAVFDLPPDTHSLTVELTYIRGGLSSSPYRRQIDWEQGLSLSIDTPENTNSVQAVVTYKTDIPRNAEISVNDEKQQVVLTGNNSVSIQLEEFTNEISVRCALDDMTDVIYRKSIYSDRIAPVLRFYEKVDAISVEEDHFLLTGETEPGCKLTVNGVEYPLNEDGSFLADLSLEKDENVFSVISTDPAGNQSAQNVTIYHGDVPAAAAIAAGQNGDGDGMGYLPMFHHADRHVGGSDRNCHRRCPWKAQSADPRRHDSDHPAQCISAGDRFSGRRRCLCPPAGRAGPGGRRIPGLHPRSPALAPGGPPHAEGIRELKPDLFRPGRCRRHLPGGLHPVHGAEPCAQKTQEYTAQPRGLGPNKAQARGRTRQQQRPPDTCRETQESKGGKRNQTGFRG